VAKREAVGVTWYAKGTTTAEAYFPEGELACKYCRFCVRDPFAPSLRHRCVLTDYLIFNPEVIAGSCPLTIIETEERNND